MGERERAYVLLIVLSNISCDVAAVRSNCCSYTSLTFGEADSLCRISSLRFKEMMPNVCCVMLARKKLKRKRMKRKRMFGMQAFYTQHELAETYILTTTTQTLCMCVLKKRERRRKRTRQTNQGDLYMYN